MTDTLQPPSAPDQTALQAPTRQVFRFNADLGGRPVEAVIEATSQQEADQYYRDQVLPRARENPSIRTVYHLQDEQSNTRAMSFNQPDEASARADLAQIYLVNQKAREFVQEVDRVDQLIEGQYDDDELANVLEETRRLQAEQPAEPDEQMRFSPMAVTRDIVTGASELPVQVLSGAAAGVNEMADTVQETANTLTELSTMPVWLENMLIPGARFANEEAAAGRVAEAPQILPELSAGAQSTTGGIIRSLGQFAAGLGVAGQVLKGWRATSMAGRVARGLTAGAIADFTAFDQAEDRLSDFIQTVPELQNPITEWLAGDEDDAALEGRLKNAIEGGLIGLPLEFAPEIVRAVSGLRRMRAAARQVKTEQRTIASQALSRQARLAEESRAAEDLLGDADAPLIDIVSEQPARAADPVGEAMARSRQGLDQAGVEGSQIEAEGLGRAAAANTDQPVRPQDPAFAQEAGQAAPDFGGNPFRINFRKIGSEDDIRSIIAQMVEARPDVIDAARRGVQNWDATATNATTIVNDPGFVERLIARQPGTAFNAGEVQAMAMLLDSSAQRVRTLAEAVRENPSAANVRAFHDMMTVHGAIDSTFMGARAEAGRALQIFRRQMTGDADAAARIDALLGSGNLQDMNRWRELADELLSSDTDSFGAIARRVPEMNTAASVRSLVQSAMLTNPSTHMAAVIGNGMGLLFETGFRALAPALRRAGGSAEGVIRDGEAMAMLAGQAQAFRDILAFRRRVQSARAAIPAAREALAGGVSPQSLGAAIGGVADAAMRPQEGGFAEFVQRSAPEMGRAEAASEGIFPAARRSTNPVVRGLATAAQAFDGTVKGVTGEIDRVFRYAAQSAGLNAAAYRQTMQEVASGALDPANAVARQRELVAAPTREMMDEAEGLAGEITFTRNHEFWTTPDGSRTMAGFGQRFLGLRESIEGLGDASPARSVIQGYLAGATMPFVHTPSNIMSYALRSSPMAPLMRRYQEDIARGGARAEVAQTRMVVGSMMLWTAYSLAAEGHITGAGPADPEQRQLLQRQGWQADSIRIGDTWYSINRLDPLGSLLSMAASMADIFVNTDWTDKSAFDQASEIVPNMILGVGNVFLNKSMLTGIQDLIQAIADRDRYGEQFFQGRLTAIIPAGVGLAERMADPYQRDPMVITDSDRTGTPEGAAIEAMESFLQAARSRTPGLSEDLPIRRDLWGREMLQVSGMGPIWEMLSPSRASHSRWTPIDSELSRLGEYPAMPQRRITVPDELRTGPGDNGQRSLSDHPDIYNRILEIRGELVLDRLNAMVEGQGFEGEIYRTLSDTEQYEMIQEILEEGGKAAREQAIEEYYDRFTDMATRRRAAEQVPLP